MTEDFDGVDWGQLENLGFQEGGVVPHILTPDMLAKRLLWDVSPCQAVGEVSRLVGLPPTSPEVEDMEHKESHQRLERSSALTPFIGPMVEHASRAVTGVMVLGHGDSVPEEERVEVAGRLAPVLYQTVFSIIAEMVDLGMLKLPQGGFLHQDVSL